MYWISKLYWISTRCRKNSFATGSKVYGILLKYLFYLQYILSILLFWCSVFIYTGLILMHLIVSAVSVIVMFKVEMSDVLIF